MNPLILVNARHACPEEVPDLVAVGDSPVLLEREAARTLEALMAELNGWRSIVPVSGWRSFQEQAADFGFVERYPAGKETVTGIAHEPWHFRYVGPAHAREVVRLGLVLEEYLT